MPIEMTFNGTSAYVPYLLFKKWTVDGWLPCQNSTAAHHQHICSEWWQSMILAIIAIFLLGVITELLSYLRVYLYTRQRLNPLKRALNANQSGSDPINKEETLVTSSTSLLAPLRIPSSVSQIKRKRIKFHCAQSFLYMIYRFSGYLLMLATMTYNMYIFLAVVLGLGVGYFSLASIRTSKEAEASMNNLHAHGSRHGGGREGLNESGNLGYSYGSL